MLCAFKLSAILNFILFGMRNHIHSLLLKFYKFHTFRQHNVSSSATTTTTMTTTAESVRRRYEAFTTWMDYPQPFKLLFAHINRNENIKKELGNFIIKTGKATWKRREMKISKRFRDLCGIFSLEMTCPLNFITLNLALSLLFKVQFLLLLLNSWTFRQVSIASGTIQFS